MSESKLKANKAEAVHGQMYYLVAGELVYIHADDEAQNPVSIRANAIVISNTGKFAVPQLAQAQQALQGGFFQRVGGVDKVTIVDVAILNIIFLGVFTAAEFNLPPEQGITVADLPAEIVETLIKKDEGSLS